MTNKTLLSIITAAALSSPFYATASPEKQPHYFQHVPTKYEDDVDRLTAKFMVYNSMTGKYPNRPSKDFFNGAITVVEKVHGVPVEFVFKNYRREFANTNHSREVVAHYTLQGREELTPAEFDTVKKDLVSLQHEASLLSYQKHSKIKEIILSSLEKQFKEGHLLKENDKLSDKLVVEVAPGVTVKDALYLPDITLADFVPTKHIFGPIPALGITYLNSGWVYYDPKARVLDHLDGTPNVLMHECEHRNIKLQRMPFAWAFDPELWASLPMLETNDALDFLIHPYYEDVRHISKVMFSFDSNYAFKKAFFITAGGIKPDREKLRKYMAQIKTISAVVQKTALDEFIPEYYAHFSFWSAVNEKLKDKNAAFKIYMYQTHEPTLLGGPQSTRTWLEKNKLVIEEASKKALQRVSEMKQEPRGGGRVDDKLLLDKLHRAGIAVEKLDQKTLNELYHKMRSLGYIR